MVLLLLRGASACREQERSGAQSSASGDASAAVQAPAGLAAELFVDRPAETWTALRALLPQQGALPAEYGALLTALLALPEDARTALKQNEPISGVVLTTGEEAALVLALPIRSGAALVAALTTGRSARYASVRDAASRLQMLRPLGERTTADSALGVCGDVLLVARSERAISSAGAYVARSVARRAGSPAGIVVSLGEAALHGTVASVLKAAWKPQATAAGLDEHIVSWVGALLQSARHVRVVVAPARDHLEARVEVEPVPGGLAAELFSGLHATDVSGLLALPADSALAMVSPSAARSSEQGARDSVRTVQTLFGERVNGAERAQLASALGAIADARGAYMSYALLTGDEPHFVLRGPVHDAAQFEAGFAGLVRALELPAVADALRPLVGPLSVHRDTSRLPGLGLRLQRARLKVREQPLELLWLSHAGIGYAVLGPRPASLLRSLLGTTTGGAAAGRAQRSLGGQAELAALVKERSRGAGFAAVIDPLRFVPGAAGGGGAPVFVTLTKRGKTGVLQVHTARPALAALAGAF